jgi:hypothetical protein
VLGVELAPWQSALLATVSIGGEEIRLDVVRSAFADRPSDRTIRAVVESVNFLEKMRFLAKNRHLTHKSAYPARGATHAFAILDEIGPK